MKCFRAGIIIMIHSRSCCFSCPTHYSNENAMPSLSLLCGDCVLIGNLILSCKDQTPELSKVAFCSSECPQYILFGGLLFSLIASSLPPVYITNPHMDNVMRETQLVRCREMNSSPKDWIGLSGIMILYLIFCVSFCIYTAIICFILIWFYKITW